MLVQAILVGLVGAFGCLDYQLGTLYAFRPLVMCPLVGLVLGVHGLDLHRRLRAA